MLAVLVCYCAILHCESFIHINCIFICYSCVAPTFSFELNKEVLVLYLLDATFLRRLVTAVVVNRFYIAPSFAFEQTHCARMRFFIDMFAFTNPA